MLAPLARLPCLRGSSARPVCVAPAFILHLSCDWPASASAPLACPFCLHSRALVVSTLLVCFPSSYQCISRARPLCVPLAYFLSARFACSPCGDCDCAARALVWPVYNFAHPIVYVLLACSRCPHSGRLSYGSESVVVCALLTCLSSLCRSRRRRPVCPALGQPHTRTDAHDVCVPYFRCCTGRALGLERVRRADPELDSHRAAAWSGGVPPPI